MWKIYCFIVLIVHSCHIEGAQHHGPINHHIQGKLVCDSKVDIVFLLDSSSSVGEEDFQNLLMFVDHLLEEAEIDSGQVRVGLMSFSTDVNIHFHLGTFTTKADITEAIYHSPYKTGSTNTADALLAMRTEMFTKHNGDRSKVPNVAVVITDGVSNFNSDRTTSEAIKAHVQGTHIFAIGIGFTGRTQELKLMVTQPHDENLFLVEKFQDLDVIRQSMFARICEMTLLKTVRKDFGRKLKEQYPPKGCEYPFDIVFIVDVNRAYTFQKAISFVIAQVKNLALNSGLARVALITSVDYVLLNQYTNNKPLLAHLQKLKKDKPVPTHGDPGEVLGHVRKHVFTLENGDREDIPNTVLVVTDNPAYASSKAGFREAKHMQDVQVMVIAIGYTVSQNKHLDRLISEPHADNKRILERSAELNYVAKPVSTSLCIAARKNLLDITHKDYVSSEKDTDIEEEIDAVVSVSEENVPEWNSSTIITDCESKSDIYIALDSSGSVGQSNFRHALEFVRNMSYYLQLKEDLHRIELLSYSDKEHVFISIKDNYTYQAISDEIDKVPYVYGSTNIASALRRITEDIQNDGRSDAEQVVIILTDGHSNLRAEDTIPESRFLKAAGATIIGLAVNMWNVKEVEEMVSTPYLRYMYNVTSFRTLLRHVPVLVPAICKVGSTACWMSACENGGICQNLVGRQECRCRKGFTGTKCELVCKRPTDMVFLLDSSGSVREHNFKRMKNFVKEVVKSLSVENCDYRYGLSKFATSALPHFYLNEYMTTSHLLNAIDELGYIYGNTDTAEAIKQVREDFFRNEKGDRPQARNVLVLVTDGLDNSRSLRRHGEAVKTRMANIGLIPIGVSVNEKEELAKMTSSHSGPLVLENYKLLENYSANFVDFIIKSENPCTNNPCAPNGKCVAESVSFSCICDFGWHGPECQSRCAPKVQVAFVIDVTSHVSLSMLTKMQNVMRAITTKLFFMDAHVPVAIISYGRTAHILLNLWSNMTKAYIHDMFSQIKLTRSKMFNSDLLSTLTRTFYGESYRGAVNESFGKVVIFLGSAKMMEQVPKDKIATRDLDSVFLEFGSSYDDRVMYQFVPKYPFITKEDTVTTHIDLMVDELMHYVCDTTDQCLTEPCAKSSTCIDARNAFACICPPGYSGKFCERDCPSRADIAFLLDASGSVGKLNFRRMLQFVNNIVSGLSIGADGSLVSVTAFSTRPEISFYFKDSKTKADVTKAVMDTKYGYGDTNMADGFKTMRQKIFTEENGDRADAQNIVILVIDGVSNVKSSLTLSEAKYIKDLGIHIFAVGIDLDDTTEIKAVASQPSSRNVFLANRYENLTEIQQSIVSHICEDENVCKGLPCENDGQCVEQLVTFKCICPTGYSGKTCEHVCEGEADVVFILDSSSSVGHHQFQLSLDFLTNITTHLDIDSGKIRLALMTFNDYATSWFYLNNYRQRYQIIEALKKVPYHDGNAFMSDALRLMREEIFTTWNGDRPTIKNKCVLITDGVSNILPQNTVTEAKKAREFGIDIISLGVGLSDDEEINAITDKADNVFMVHSYSDLHLLEMAVAAKICNSFLYADENADRMEP